MVHKAGFVNIIGSPNVGKSTLMNQLVGEQLSIITSKAQTTRHRILGIVNGEYKPAEASEKVGFQVVYSDTPGIVKPAYKLHEGMMKFVSTAIADADVLLVMVEIGETTFKDERIFGKLQNAETPVLLLINKIDTAEEDTLQKNVAHWQEQFPKAAIHAISALKGTGVEDVFNSILERIPEAPPYFPKEELTDKPERFFVSEIIREKIFLNYKQEIPYSTEVIIESFKEEEKIIRIRAEIMVARQSQKGIIIGKNGAALKKVGTQARKDIEKFFGKKVFLETYVKVDKDWRNDNKKLKNYGYL